MIITWILGVLGIIIVSTVLLNIFRNWKKMMNYKNLFTALGVSILSLSLLFNIFTIELVFKILLISLVLVVSLFYGAFKK
jgi:hypothetical protein